MFNKSHIKKYVFISSILINLLIIALIFIPKEKGVKTNEPTLPAPTVAGVSKELYLVKKVIDGDTIALDSGEVVRYIGIDTPELSQKAECYSRESSEKNKELVEGKTVRLEKDVSERDKYGRLLRYVYASDIFVNEYMVRLGYAKVSTYPPDVKYQQVFLQAERQAREDNLGLWSSCKGDFL